jgi:hypothetical protein
MATAKKTTTPAVVAAPASLAEFNPRDPQTLLATAAQLAQFVKDNNLASSIKGRSYVQCEGWQFLFAVAGLDVLCAKPVRLDRAGEVCYEAEARLFDQNGREVGYGYALCSDAESTKRGWAEYAIASMAQTRAIGKGGRNRFSFVMKAAGFEPTPAEEMSEVGTSASVVHETPAKPAAGNAPAASASTSPAPSTTSDQSIAGPAEIPAEILGKYTRQLEAAATMDEVASIWSKLTKNEAKALETAKNAAKQRLANQAAAQASRENPGVMKVAGKSDELVFEFIQQPTAGSTDQPVQYATASQKEEIIRLLNHPLITRREKTKLLLRINRLDEQRATDAIAKLRQAIEDREGINPDAEARRDLQHFISSYADVVGSEHTDRLSALVEDATVSVETLRGALAEGRELLLDIETYGSEAELTEADSDEIPAAA